jgi:hypothetical protein
MDKRAWIMGILSNLVTFIILFNIFAFVYIATYERVPWAFLILIIPFFSLFVLRRLVKDMGIFLVAHIIYLILPFFILEGFFIIILTTLFVAVAVALSVFQMMNGERILNGNKALMTIIMLILSLIALSAAGHIPAGTEILINVSALLVLAAVVLYVHMDNLDACLSASHIKKEELAEKSVLGINNILAAVFTMGVVVFAALSIFIPGGRVFVSVFRGIGFFLNSIIWLLVRFLSFILPDIQNDTYLPGGAAPEAIIGSADVEPVDRSENPDLLLTILGLAIWIIVGLFVIFLAIIIIKVLLDRVGSQNVKRETSAHNDTISRLKFSLSDLAMFLPSFKINHKHPIRKAYIKKVKSHIKQGVAVEPYHTPEIIADNIRSTEDIYQLTESYRVVRYGRS